MATEWTLADGTRIEIGGWVYGETFLASWLRARLTSVRHGPPVSAGYGPAPYEEPLDLNVDYLLDAYLRRLLGARVVSGPSVEYPKLEPRDPLPPGAMY